MQTLFLEACDLAGKQEKNPWITVPENGMNLAKRRNHGVEAKDEEKQTIARDKIIPDQKEVKKLVSKRSKTLDIFFWSGIFFCLTPLKVSNEKYSKQK